MNDTFDMQATEQTGAPEKHRLRRLLMPIAVVVCLLIAAGSWYSYHDSDFKGYILVVSDYYQKLNAGSDYGGEYEDQDIKKESKDYLDDRGFSDLTEWYAALQMLDTEIMEEKYGEGFKVSYEIIETEKLSNDELEELASSVAADTSYDKGYKLKVKEHFKGSKSEGDEEQDLTVLHDNRGNWGMLIERWTELKYELPYVEK